MALSLRYDRVVAVANPIALAAAIAAWKFGLAIGRMRPGAAFLAAGTILAPAREAAVQGQARRARLRASLPLKWEVPLREPLWSRTSGTCAAFAFAAMLGAAASLAGSAGLGAGIATTVVLIRVGSQQVLERWRPRSLTFAADGLHVALRRCRFAIAWNDVTGAETSARGDSAELGVLSVQRALASVVPSDDRARRQVWYALHDGSGVTGRLVLPGALAGVDGATLARAIGAAAATRSAAKPN